jgi:hypothetical protein
MEMISGRSTQRPRDRISDDQYTQQTVGLDQYTLSMTTDPSSIASKSLVLKERKKERKIY